MSEILESTKVELNENADEMKITFIPSFRLKQIPGHPLRYINIFIEKPTFAFLPSKILKTLKYRSIAELERSVTCCQKILDQKYGIEGYPNTLNHKKDFMDFKKELINDLAFSSLYVLAKKQLEEETGSLTASSSTLTLSSYPSTMDITQNEKTPPASPKSSSSSLTGSSPPMQVSDIDDVVSNETLYI